MLRANGCRKSSRIQGVGEERQEAYRSKEMTDLWPLALAGHSFLSKGHIFLSFQTSSVLSSRCQPMSRTILHSLKDKAWDIHYLEPKWYKLHCCAISESGKNHLIGAMIIIIHLISKGHKKVGLKYGMLKKYKKVDKYYLNPSTYTLYIIKSENSDHLFLSTPTAINSFRSGAS